MTYLVVFRLFLRVAQDLVGFINLLELLLSLFAPFVEIRVIFPCQNA